MCVHTRVHTHTHIHVHTVHTHTNTHTNTHTYIHMYIQIQCRDCREESETDFHIVGLKCSKCSSYNTVRCGNEELPEDDGEPDDQVVPLPLNLLARLQVGDANGDGLNLPPNVVAALLQLFRRVQPDDDDDDDDDEEEGEEGEGDDGGEEEDISDVPPIETDSDGDSDRNGGVVEGGVEGEGEGEEPHGGEEEGDDGWVDVEEEGEEGEEEESSEEESWDSASDGSNDPLVNPFPWLPLLQWGIGDWGEGDQEEQSDRSDVQPSSAEQSDNSWETEDEEVVIGGSGAGTGDRDGDPLEDWDEGRDPEAPEQFDVPQVEAYDAHIRLDLNGHRSGDSSNSWETADEEDPSSNE